MVKEWPSILVDGVKMTYITFLKDFTKFAAGDGVAFRTDDPMLSVYLESTKDGSPIAAIDHERMKRDKVLA